MNLKKTIFLAIIIVLFNACGGGSSTDNKNSNKTTEVSEEPYNSEKKLFPSKITTIQYHPQDTTQKISVITSTFKYNNKNLMIKQTTTMHEYNKSKITLTINIKVKYDNQNRYIEHEGIQENFIPNQPTRTVHSSAKMKYKNDKIAEEYYYNEGVLSNKWIVTEWDGNKPLKRQNIGYSKDGEETLISTQINTYERENIIHTELHQSDGGINTTDRVFDDKKIPEWNDVVQRKYYTYCAKGKNNAVSETLISPRRTLTVENRLKYNDKNMIIEEDSYRYYTDSDYVFREKTVIEYVER